MREGGKGREEEKEEELATYPARGYTLPLARSHCPPSPSFASLSCHVTPTLSSLLLSFVVVLIIVVLCCCPRCCQPLLSSSSLTFVDLVVLVLVVVVVVVVYFRLCSHYCRRYSRCHPHCVVCGGGNNGAGGGQWWLQNNQCDVSTSH